MQGIALRHSQPVGNNAGYLHLNGIGLGGVVYIVM